MRKSKFEHIMNQYKDRIYTQAFYFTGCDQDAEDITQEVFIRLWQHADKIDRSHIYAWLCRVNKNLCIDFSRKKREVSISGTNQDDDRMSYEELIQDSSPNPEQTLIHKDLYDKVIERLEKLPGKIRMIVIMRDIQDCSYEFIAKSLSIPMNTVKSYLHRGRKMLARDIQNLKEEYQSEK